MDVVVTDYGNVKLSKQTISWLDSVDPDWRELCHNKRRRGKRAKAMRELIRRVEDAIHITARIRWYNNDDLIEF